MYGNIGAERVDEVLEDSGRDGERADMLLTGTSSSDFQALEEEERRAVIIEIAAAMRPAWATFLAAGSLCLVLACFMGSGRMHAPLQSHEGDNIPPDPEVDTPERRKEQEAVHE
ncbi:hypothetical protein BDY21DRAFT_419541 [Lineolata rhizophorae]|uniref:Uncharacterized protein n=1 Tax=Lineolata rhizophorae TaxID=578093 RepID=A0A6A6P7E4_9PEZI|nr:hypothetical protein BDY21DRAFT_419541 [Lineolata rhizophorae]